MTSTTTPSPLLDLRREPEQALGERRATDADAIARISSDQLLGGGTEVHIEHRGSLYRLKQTSLGKLILTK